MNDAVLIIDVKLDEIIEVNGSEGKAAMILFHGDCDCENFKGKILQGGVDTQKEAAGEKRLMSARYVLEGTDKDGENCRIFIENNGICENPGEDVKTTPVIYTDSSALKWLETAELYGTVQGSPTGVKIFFYKK